MDRRNFLRAAAAAAASSVAVPAFGQDAKTDPPGAMPPPRDWNDPSTAIYPDPAFEVFDPRFAKYSGGTAGLVRVWTGGVWTEGPVWFGDQQRLIFSDIPNDRLMAYDVTTGKTQVFRQPSNFTNGNTRDRQGRLISCEQGTRRVTRTEYDGTITVLADKFNGKPLNSQRRDRQVRRHGVVHRPELRHRRRPRGQPRQGGTAAQCLPPRSEEREDGRRRRRLQHAKRALLLARREEVLRHRHWRTGWRVQANADPGLRRGRQRQAHKRKADARLQGRPQPTSPTTSAPTRTATSGRPAVVAEPRDERRARVRAGRHGARRDRGAEVAANFFFGGHHHNRLFICASTSIYAIDVGTRGVEL